MNGIEWPFLVIQIPFSFLRSPLCSSGPVLGSTAVGIPRRQKCYLWRKAVSRPGCIITRSPRLGELSRGTISETSQDAGLAVPAIRTFIQFLCAGRGVVWKMAFF